MIATPKTATEVLTARGLTAEQLEPGTDFEVAVRIEGSRDAGAWHRLFYAGDGPLEQPASADLELARIITRHTDDDAQAERLMQTSMLVRHWSENTKKRRAAFIDNVCDDAGRFAST